MSLLSASQQIQQEQQAEAQVEPTPMTPTEPAHMNGHGSHLGAHEVEPQRRQRFQPRQPSVSVQSLLLPRSPTIHLERVDIVTGLSVTFAQADSALDVYRTVYSPQFPFVPVHPHISAAELYEKQPFLFRMIMQAVIPQPPQTQDAVKQWFREYIAQHVVVRAERDIELLQGILLFLAWYGL